MKELSKCDKINATIAPKMIYLIAFFHKNVKSDICTGGDIYGLYCYIETIEYPTNLTYLSQQYHNFVT